MSRKYNCYKCNYSTNVYNSFKLHQESLYHDPDNKVITEKDKVISVKQKKQDTNIIPLNIFQTWFTKDLPEKMREAVESVKRDNPEFKHHLFDDNDCYNFIKDNFSKDVLAAFENLIPGAYKADLWRYCVLYIHGGIYLDIKLKCANGFKLINLVDQEHYVRDIDVSGRGIYNAFLVCKPNNSILLNCINAITYYSKIKFYGRGSLEPTGPLLMKRFFTSKEITDMPMFVNAKAGAYIGYYDDNIIVCYDEYRDEQRKSSNKDTYHDMWSNKKVYVK